MTLNLSQMRSLGEAIRDCGIPFKSNLALLEANRDTETARLTHREVHREGERVATLLEELGFKAGDRAALLMPNQSKWVLSALGIFWAGGVLVPLDYKLTPREQAALLAHSQPKVLFADASIWERFEKEGEKFPRGLRVILTEPPAEGKGKDVFLWGEKPGAAFKFRERERDDVASLIYSSGTGGQTKGCLLTHGGFLRQIEQLAAVVKPTEEDRYFSIIPANHAIDFMCGFLMPLVCGASVVHQRTLRSQYLVSTMKRYGATLVALVPLLLKMFKEGIEEKIEALSPWEKEVFRGLKHLNESLTRKEPRPQLSRLLLKKIHDGFGGKLRQIIVGGAYVDRKVAEFFYQIGLPVSIGYGLTEAGTAITLNDLKPFRGDSVGRPLPGMEVEVRDPDPEGVGEVWVKGPTVMKGYFKDPDLTSEVLVDEWLRTGDLGKFDASGHLKLLGRSKNMIVTEGGKNVYPEDIEIAFEGLAGCEEFCVFAANYVWPEKKLTGEKLMVVVRPAKNGGGSSWVEELRRRNRTLVDFKRIEGYVIWNEEFPRTSTLKVKRQQFAQILKGALRREEAFRPL
ncbi:MAG: AMP-binding protein [bacterium]